MCLGGLDTKAIEKDKKAAERKERVENQKRKHDEEKLQAEVRQKNAAREMDQLLGEEAAADDEVEPNEVRDPTYSPPATRRKLEPPSPLNVPRNILLREEVQMSMSRNKISPECAVDLFSAIVAASGGNIASYSLSASHVGKERGKAARKSLESEKRDWNPPNPAVCI